MRNVSRLVMVVDDDESVRLYLKRLLHAAGYEVRTFSETHQLLSHRRPDVPCCVILDFRLPGTDGLEVQQQLRVRGIRVPIIFLSGHADVATSVAAMKAGASDFLTKPVNSDALLTAVARAIAADMQSFQENQHLAELQLLYRTLTPREREVFSGVVSGMLNKQIAIALGITEKTVKIHRGRVMEKMRADSLAELVRGAGALEQDSPEILEGVLTDGRKSDAPVEPGFYGRMSEGVGSAHAGAAL